MNRLEKSLELTVYGLLLGLALTYHWKGEDARADLFGVGLVLFAAINLRGAR